MKRVGVCGIVVGSVAGGEVGFPLVHPSPFVSWTRSFRAPLSVPRVTLAPEHGYESSFDGSSMLAARKEDRHGSPASQLR